MDPIAGAHVKIPAMQGRSGQHTLIDLVDLDGMSLVPFRR
jgi:hypothetical protein